MRMARPARFERATAWFVGKHSDIHNILILLKNILKKFPIETICRDTQLIDF